MRRKAGIIKAELAAAAEDETHELTGIVVHEVSVVDRPANKRKFLLVKRDASTEEQKDAGMKLQGAKKDELLKAMKGLQETAAAITAAVEKATVADDAATPNELQKALEGIAALSAALVPQAPAPATVATTPAVAPTEPAVKAGRKLSTARSAKLQQATGMLVELLTEIAGTPATEATEEEAPEETAKAAVAKPKVAAAPAAPATDPALMATLTTLTEGLSSLTKAMKIQKERLDQMSTGAPGSNQPRGSDLSEGERMRAEKSRPVSWPLDMNDPITKENTPAEISFFD